VNCAACHAWDYDDTILPALLHPGSVAVPTALAIAERSRMPVAGRTLVTSLAAGYEVGNVVGTALGGKAFASDGFYNSVPAIFVAAATAGKLLGLNELQLMRLLGLAAQQAAGLYSATLAKRFNAPKAVLGGVFAADLARRGMEAPVDGIEAEYSGFLKTFSRAPNPDVIPRDLGQYRFEIYHKFYPCIRSNHPTVENVKRLLEENPDIETRSIRRIVSHVDPLTVDYTLKTTAGGAEGVRTVGNALISLPYCVAAVTVDRELTLRQFTLAKLRDPGIKALMKTIELRADRSIDRRPATQRYRCKVEVHLANGRVIKRELVGPKGDPNNRLTRGELVGKFVDNAAPVMPAWRAQRLFTLLEGLHRVGDVRSIARWLAVRSPRGQSRRAGEG
jgi:2-methylcitrate dehydratase PrpD